MEKDISKLQPHEIEAYISEPNKKSADLLEGYRIAKDPTKWIAERDALASKAHAPQTIVITVDAAAEFQSVSCFHFRISILHPNS